MLSSIYMYYMYVGPPLHVPCTKRLGSEDGLACTV